VVHGPPGTGKSQTISNLIADALGQGKSILFVSAKMAALDVVHRRLAEVGLDRFCLEAHSTKAGKAKIIEELRRTLAEADGDGHDDRLDEQVEELLRRREELNAYVRALHQRRAPLGMSAYEAIGRAEKVRGEAEVPGPLPWSDVLAVNRAGLGTALDALSDLGAQADVFDHRESHPWRGLAVEPGLPVRLDVIEADLRMLRAPFRRLLELLRSLEPLLGDADARLTLETIQALAPVLQELARIERLPRSWSTRDAAELQAKADLLDEAASKAEEEALGAD
jgi:hypothetical protein